MTHSVGLLLLFSSIFCVYSCSDAENSFRVVGVLDGDTVVLENGWHVRYLGIDTPELRRKQANKWIEVKQEFSQEAKQFNEAMVLNKVLRLEFDRVKKDKYGRWLAYCYVDGKMVNMEILRRGLGFIFFISPNDKYAEEFKRAQWEAIRAKRGIWAKDGIITPEEMPKYNFQVRMVKGKVCKVINTGTRTYLYLSCNPYALRRITLPYVHFQAYGLDKYRLLEGKEICCIGKVRCKKNLCEIKIFHPVQLYVDLPYQEPYIGLDTSIEGEVKVKN